MQVRSKENQFRLDAASQEEILIRLEKNLSIAVSGISPLALSDNPTSYTEEDKIVAYQTAKAILDKEKYQKYLTSTQALHYGFLCYKYTKERKSGKDFVVNAMREHIDEVILASDIMYFLYFERKDLIGRRLDELGNYNLISSDLLTNKLIYDEKQFKQVSQFINEFPYDAYLYYIRGMMRATSQIDEAIKDLLLVARVYSVKDQRNVIYRASLDTLSALLTKKSQNLQQAKQVSALLEEKKIDTKEKVSDVAGLTCSSKQQEYILSAVNAYKSGENKKTKELINFALAMELNEKQDAFCHFILALTELKSGNIENAITMISRIKYENWSEFCSYIPFYHTIEHEVLKENTMVVEDEKHRLFYVLNHSIQKNELKKANDAIKSLVKLFPFDHVLLFTYAILQELQGNIFYIKTNKAAMQYFFLRQYVFETLKKVHPLLSYNYTERLNPNGLLSIIGCALTACIEKNYKTSANLFRIIKKMIPNSTIIALNIMEGASYVVKQDDEPILTSLHLQEAFASLTQMKSCYYELLEPSVLITIAKKTSTMPQFKKETQALLIEAIRHGESDEGLIKKYAESKNSILDTKERQTLYTDALNKNYEMLFAHCEPLLDQFTFCSELYYLRAIAAYHRSDYQQAIKDISVAITLDNKTSDSYTKRIKQFFENMNCQDLFLLKELNKFRNQNIALCSGFSKKITENNYKDFIEGLEKAITALQASKYVAMDFYLAEMYFKLGQCFFYQGNAEKSEGYFKLASEINFHYEKEKAKYKIKEISITFSFPEEKKDIPPPAESKVEEEPKKNISAAKEKWKKKREMRKQKTLKKSVEEKQEEEKIIPKTFPIPEVLKQPREFDYSSGLFTRYFSIAYLFNICRKNNSKLFIVGGFLRDLELNGSVDTDIDLVVEAAGNSYPECLKPFVKSKSGNNHFLYHVHTSVDLRCSKFLNKSLEFDAENIPDFTINALYGEIKSGKLHVYDPTGLGLKHLKKKLISPVKPVKISFKEDPMRMLRAIYLKNKLGFRLSQEMEEKIPDCLNDLRQCQDERVNYFFNKKIFSRSYSEGILDDLIKYNMIQQFYTCPYLTKEYILQQIAHWKKKEEDVLPTNILHAIESAYQDSFGKIDWKTNHLFISTKTKCPYFDEMREHYLGEFQKKPAVSLINIKKFKRL